MAFADFVQKVAPFGGRMLGLDKGAREKFAPRKQPWGGSEGYAERMRNTYETGAANADKDMRAGLERSNTAADKGATAYAQMRSDSDREQMLAGMRAEEEREAARGGAAKMVGIADNYQQTADAQLRSAQDTNQRQAMGLAAGRGAAGLRSALAGSTAANQQAATNAQIVNAQEQNERANIYGQAAGLYSGREAQERQNALAQQGIQGNAIGGQLAAQQNAAQLQTGAGMGTRGQFLGAQAAQNTAELNAAREYEQQRQQNEKYNYTQDWFPLKRFNAPA